jgi:peptide methionine sulfoxide reductase MsrB
MITFVAVLQLLFLCPDLVKGYTATGISRPFLQQQYRHKVSLKVFSDDNSDNNNNGEGFSRRQILSSSSLLVTTTLGLVLSTTTNSANAAATTADFVVGGKIKYGDESIMSPKEHGTSSKPVQDDLLYGVSNKLADRICNYNRHFAEMGGYSFSDNISFVQTVLDAKEPITFYDSVTGKPLFKAPIGRTAQQFITESQIHGWPSFRDTEVIWDNVRILKNGESVSVDGTHLGHNLPDKYGNRYCINLVSIAGRPLSS